MASLLDIAEVSVAVPIRGHDIHVVGITGKDIANLMRRFPQVRAMMDRTAKGGVSIDDIMGMAGDVIAAVIAAGTGMGGNEEAEKRAASLTVGEQASLIYKIFEVSFPLGFEHFVSTINQWGRLVGSDEDENGGGTAQDMNSPAQSSS